LAPEERDRQAIVSWLGPPFPTSAFNDAQRLRSVDTGNWFLEGKQYERWKQSPHSVLWLSGIPGSGKTILCSSIIAHLNAWCRPYDTRLVIYYFFEFSARDKDPVGIFLRSVLSQIVIQKEHIPISIQELFDQHHKGFQQPSIKTLLETLLTNLEGSDQTYFVLDALDECGARVDLLDTLEEIDEWHLDNLHLLATSRREKDIEESFARICGDLIQLEGSKINRDIEQYVHQRLLKERWLKKWPEDVQHEITSTIIMKAGEMFRLAAMQINGLRHCGTLKALREALHTLPTSLDETYSRILDEIEPAQADNATRILSWLCFAFRPLALDEIAESLAIDFENNEYDATQKLQDLEDVLSICGSLVVRANDSTLKLSHYSVKEYLISDRLLGSKNSGFHMNPTLSDANITQTCLIYLQNRSFGGTFGLGSDSLTQYATEFWIEHFIRCGQPDQLVLLAKEMLFTDKLHFLERTRIYRLVLGGCWTERPREDSLNAALYYTAWTSSPGLMETALIYGAEINADAGEFGTALNVSAYLGDMKSVELLLARGADVNCQSGLPGNALQAAVTSGSIHVIELLLSRGADVNKQGGRYYTALNAAMCLRRSQDKVVEILLDAGAEPLCFTDAINEWSNQSPLKTITAMGGAIHIAKLLLDRGADAKESGILQVALSKGNIDLVNLLFERGASVNDGWRWANPLAEAAANGLATLRCVIENWNGDYKFIDPEGRNVLHIAAREGAVDTVQYLLGLGLSIDQTDMRGWTAIHYAAEAKTPDNLRFLLSLGTPKTSSSAIWTPLHLACRRNQPEALDLLVQAGFQPTIITTSEPQWQWNLYEIAIVHRNANLISADLAPLHPLLSCEYEHIERPRKLLYIHTGRICDGCYSTLSYESLIGPVFHCDECPNFDYCFMCMVTADKTHPHSSWKELPHKKA
jgi:ankyrin repeat protein